MRTPGGGHMPATTTRQMVLSSTRSTNTGSHAFRNEISPVVMVSPSAGGTHGRQPGERAGNSPTRGRCSAASAKVR